MSSDAHGAVAPAGSGLHHPYHLPDPSPWPIAGAFGGFLTVFGIILAAHYNNYLVLIAGLALVLITMFFWWRDVVHEARTPGAHTAVVRLGLRYGMVLFISSEVMFFVGFFWSFFNFLLYPETQGNGQTVWPPSTIHTFDYFHLPLLNTMILLLSGCTVTFAHHALLEGDKKGLVRGLGITILLGLSFTLCVSSRSSSTRSLALMREKWRHFGFIRNLRPSAETAALKWFATASCMPSLAMTRNTAARSMRSCCSSGAAAEWCICRSQDSQGGPE